MIFCITQFSEGSHWDAAIVEAPNERAAYGVLRAALNAHAQDDSYENGYLETLYADSIRPETSWRCKPVENFTSFILGAGCRSTGSSDDSEARAALGIWNVPS